MLWLSHFSCILQKQSSFSKVVGFAATWKITLFWTDESSPSIQTEFKTNPLLKSKASAQLYFGPERSAFASQEIWKNYPKSAVKFCRWELTQKKWGLFFLRLKIRKEKEMRTCKNTPIALAINTSNNTVSKLGTAPAEVFSLLKLSSILKRNRGRNQQRHTRRQYHAWMTYRVFQA